jgi:TatD DNase family protein
MLLIDTHCHLNFSQYDADRKAVIGNAKKAGIKKFIIPGNDLPSSIKAIELSHEYPQTLWAAVGYHPYESETEPDINNLTELIGPTVVAIGECGLDYHLYNNEAALGKKYRQQKLFENHAKFALKYNLPLIIHSRDAFSDVFSVIDSLPTKPRGVIHCFTGGLEDIRMAIERNLYIGIDGNVTFSKHLQTVVPQIPLDRLLIETDSPYLTPIPHRGKRNEPKYLFDSAKFISGLYQLPIAQLAELTTKNATCLFQLE